MYLSDLEIKGFKSFALPTHLKFADGLTCIVGPNGCGKTNVVDAIRWVLGEQKTSILRSHTMNDVIFNGSAARKRTNFAEVSLVIKNDKGILPLEYDEIRLTRRLYRDGTSEYFLNKTPCRLKDIQDLFADTGMGSNAYSVIELRMVESILSEDKEERRRLLEEAAGVKKYKQQRRLSERRLEATEMDLARVQDIILEVEKKVRSLKRQLSRYKRFAKVHEQLREDELLLAKWQLYQIRQEREPLEFELRRLNSDLSLSKQEVQELERQVQQARFQLDQAREERDEAYKKLETRRNEEQELEKGLLLAEEKMNQAAATLDKIKVEEQTLLERQRTVQAAKGSLENELQHLSPQLEQAKQAADQVRRELAQVTETYAQTRKQHEETSKKHLQLLNEINRLRNQDGALKASLENIHQQLQRLQSKRGLLIEQSGRWQTELGSTSSSVTQAQQDLKMVEERLTEAENKLREDQERLTAVREKLAEMRGERASLESRISFYEEVLESGEGYSPGVREILQSTSKFTGVLGTVADLIQVDDKLAPAVQAALGDLAQLIVTKDRKAALEAIEHLQKSGRGRATFLPLEAVARLAPHPTEPAPWKSATPLQDAVSVAPPYQPLVAHLFHDVWLAQESPPQDFQPSHGLVVSLDGRLWSAAGWLQGGSSDSQETLVGRRDRLARLRKRYQKLVDEQNKATAELQQLYETVGREERELRRLRAERENQRQNLQEKERQSSRARFNLANLETELETLKAEEAQLQAELEQKQAARSKLAPRLKELLQQQEELKSELDSLTVRNQSEATRRDQIAEKVQNARIQVVTLENAKVQLETRLKNLEQTLEEVAQRQETLEKERQQQKEILAANHHRREELERQRKDVLHQRQETENLLQNFDAQLQERKKKVELLEKELREKGARREELLEKLRELEVRKTEILEQEKHLRARIAERYQVELEVPATFAEPPDEEALRQRIARNERFIERLGPINQAVEQEYEEENSRLRFLQEQQADLLEAKASLQETIHKLDRLARKRFKEVFQQIQEYFKVTFQMLFDGGDAQLELADPENPLDSDIVIRATPKGKNPRNLRMLSSGEKALTAIALLFAIYQVKPSPYCVLDEIDAPLDDHNIRKFTRMLESLSKKTQFLVITHNKITMEAAKYLYGVTMEEEGVSKLVSVQLT